MGKKNNKDSLTPRETSYWITKYATHGNNWIVADNWKDIIDSNEQKIIVSDYDGTIITDPRAHELELVFVYTSYLSQFELCAIACCKNYEGMQDLYVIKNTNIEYIKQISSKENEEKIDDKELKLLEELKKRNDEISEMIKEEAKACDTDDQTDKETVQVISKIYKVSNWKDAISCLTSNERKQMDIVKTDKMKLKSADISALKGVVVSDFCESPHVLKIWNKYVQGSGERLNLNMNQVITSEIIEEGVDGPDVTELVLSQNIQLEHLRWISKFKKLEHISIWFDKNLTNEKVAEMCEEIVKYNIPVKAVDIHSCNDINIRVMIDLLKINGLQSICLDNPVMKCQESVYSGLIVNEELKDIKAESMLQLAINSDNFTKDVISDLLSVLPNLQTLLISTPTLHKIAGDIIEGYSDKTIAIRSFTDENEGKVFKKDIRITDLVRDRVDKPYSDSMLNKIKEIQERKNRTTN